MAPIWVNKFVSRNDDEQIFKIGNNVISINQ